MNLPENITATLEELTEKHGIKTLKAAAESLSLNYREAERSGEALIKGEASVVAYAVSRMPATYGAVYTALKYINEIVNLAEIETLTDVGAGTGAATLAVGEYAELKKATLLERDPDMSELGKRLVGGDWIRSDAKGAAIPTADMVISSYMLNEFSPESRVSQVEKMWQSAKKLMVIVENGTPKGYEIIKEIRSWARARGIAIAAPCPNLEKCPVEEGDWCHFACRIPRSKTHKLLKGGDAPYEDEKFTYIALSKTEICPVTARVLRHPKIESGKITLSLCTDKGAETVVKTKKDKALFKAARKSSAGDSFPY